MLQSRLSLAGPKSEQSFPSYSGAGLLHCRALTLSPPPQDREHNEKSDHSPKPPSTGQGFVLQGTTSLEGPIRVQSSPPASGLGFVQLRVRKCVPPAQDFVHGLKTDHCV